MKYKHNASNRRPLAAPLVGAVTAACLAMISPAVHAIDFGEGDFEGSVDTTLSYGVMWRLEDRDPDLIGIANAAANGGEGYAYSVNGDDGNLNYDKGIVSNAAKITSEVELSYRSFGGFLRGTAFYDYENKKGDRERTELTDDALDRVGSRAEILDAYLWGKFDTAMPFEIRAGEQVISWGESTFIQNGINAINPVDVSKLRVPGAELREALKPVGLVSASLGTSSNTSVQVFYQYRWEETIIDPPGTYFSTNDFAGEGGTELTIGFGSVAEGTAPLAIPRGATVEPDDDGQYGIAFSWLLPAEIELGLYYMNYHSRLPIISAHAVTGAPPNTADYFTEYPEDIQLYGIGMNGNIGGTNIAIQGEYSYRKDVPLQVDDVELLFSALCQPISQLGACPNGLGGEIHGFERLDVSQLQFTLTDVFGPMLGMDQWVLLAEFGANYVHEMPTKNTLRFDGPGTYLPGDATAAAGNGVPQQTDGFADRFSWGYRALARFDFNNAVGAINLSPRLAFAHDVDGTSPGPGGSFIEDRRALTVGILGTYQNSWSADVAYTRYYGASSFNLINDRDFIAANIKYSF